MVAVVGRPNVGKSTLFNVLAGERISIVKDTPGITRDRIYADAEWLDHRFTLVDTGGIEPESKDILLSQMREQAQIAIDTADVILFMVDVKQGLVDSDSKVADMLRKVSSGICFRSMNFIIWASESLLPFPRQTGWGSVRCWMRLLPISRRVRERRRTMTRSEWRSWVSPMWENLRLSTGCSEKTG